VGCLVGQWMVGCVDLLGWVCITGGRVVYGGPWFRCSVYGSYVGMGGGAFVGLVCLTSRSFSGLLFSAGVFCLQGSVMCAWLWRIWLYWSGFLLQYLPKSVHADFTYIAVHHVRNVIHTETAADLVAKALSAHCTYKYCVIITIAGSFC